MTQGPEITGLAAWIFLLLPFAALAAAIALALRKPAVRGSGDQAGAPRGRYGAPLSTRQPPAHEPPSGPATDKKPAVQEGAHAPSDLERALKRAEGKGDESELAELHFAYAREKLAAGRVAEAADLLRKSIRVASRIGKKKVHAEARLELAEIARADGDLTTACEHWQIARGLFSELKQARELDKAETLMRQHGCPTDWILNDF
jgi:tetratricopeptide (TPR) repeat protein